MSEQRALVACEGGPAPGWVLVDVPLPLEVDRDGKGIYVLDDLGAEPRYVYVDEVFS
jgi:hypothetical protein